MIANRATEIYLDSNATTQVMPKAATAAFDAMEDLFGNPSSSHISGLRARSLLEATRTLAQSVLGSGDGQIVFTSGATEAIQMAIFSTLCEVRKQRQESASGALPKRTLLFGATEHKAIPQALRHWNQLLHIENDVVEIPVDENGQLDLDFIRNHAANADMICTMAVNNETGVIHDLKAIEIAIRESNPDCLWLVDGVQAIGKLQLSLATTSIDYAAFSGHKIYAPKGIGLLYCRQGKPLTAMMAGGGQESGARGGTENLPGVAAIAAVLEELDKSPTKTFADQNRLIGFRDQITTALKDAFPEVVFNTPFAHAVPTTVNFAVKSFESKELLDLFDAAGIRVSSGSACGSGVSRSYVLDAMGVDCWRSTGAIRLSFGPLHRELEIESACKKIREAGKALSAACLVISNDTEDNTQTELDGLIQLKKGSDCTWLFLDAESKTCIVVDPFESLAKRVESLVRCQDSRVVAVLDSHGHVDHDSCRTMLLNAMRSFQLESASTGDLLGWPTGLPTLTVGDGTSAEYFELGKLVVAKVELPGHTTISNAYLVGRLDDRGELPAPNVQFAFTGDTILMGGIGRTDFESSTISGMYNSLQKLPKLICETTLICPTHDYNNEFATTLKLERSTNDLLEQIVDPVSPMSLDEFTQTKPGVDKGITDETNSELVCGFLKDPGKECDSNVNSVSDLKTFIDEHPDAIILDVREPHEFCFAQDWHELGLETPPKNVPLTQLTGFTPYLLSEKPESTPVIFLCRSGKRSKLAAELVTRLGVANVKHIHGGIALNLTQSEMDPEFVI